MNVRDKSEHFSDFPQYLTKLWGPLVWNLPGCGIGDGTTYHTIDPKPSEYRLVHRFTSPDGTGWMVRMSTVVRTGREYVDMAVYMRDYRPDAEIKEAYTRTYSHSFIGSDESDLWGELEDAISYILTHAGLDELEDEG